VAGTLAAIPGCDVVRKLETPPALGTRKAAGETGATHLPPIVGAWRDQGAVEAEGKEATRFADAGSTVGRRLWEHGVYPRAGHPDTLARLPMAFRQHLLDAPAPAG
jgi:hypothetical protein